MAPELTTAISTVGFPIVSCIGLGIFIYKIGNKVLKIIMERMERQDSEIAIIRKQREEDKQDFESKLSIMQEEKREEKAIFNKTVEIFGITVQEFKAVNNKIDSLESKVDDLVTNIKK
ncbi:MAG: hypothetical protein RSC24_06550 [Clostridium sp.]